MCQSESRPQDVINSSGVDAARGPNGEEVLSQRRPLGAGVDLGCRDRASVHWPFLARSVVVSG